MGEIEEIKNKIREKLEELYPDLKGIDLSSLDSLDISILQSFYNKKTNDIKFLSLLKITFEKGLKNLFWILLTNGDPTELETTAKYLKENGEDVYSKDKDGNTLLHHAARRSFLKDMDISPLLIMEAIVGITLMEEKQDIIFAKNNFGYTPLRCAIENLHMDAVDFLAKCYKNFNIKRDKWSLVHFAAQINKQMLPTLLKNGWDIDELDGERRTLLSIAAEKGDDKKEYLEFLLKRGASLNKKVQKGYTPILAAVSRDQLETVKFFIKDNPFIIDYPEQKDFEDKPIMIVATEHNSTSVSNYFMGEAFRKEVIDFLIRKNNGHLNSFQAETADSLIHSILNTYDIYENCPLHIVAQTGNMEIFEHMIKFYTKTQIENFQRQTPLHFAAENGHEEIFKQLLSKGALINSPDAYCVTPFFLACENDSNGIIEHVMKNVDLSGSIDCRRKYLDIAIITKNLYLLKLIFEKYNSFAPLDELLIIDADNQACFKKAIETGFEDAVKYILNFDCRDIFFRRQLPSNYNQNSKSPMQLLIEHMPKMACLAFDQFKINENNQTLFNFEFLDDIFYPKYKKKNEISCFKFLQGIKNFSRCHTPQTNTEEGTPLRPIGKGAALQSVSSSQMTAEKYDQIIANHPLSLIVKFNRHDLLFHPLVELYIDTKWNRFAKWGYYALCFFHFLVVTFLTWALFDAKPILLLKDAEEKKNETVLKNFLMPRYHGGFLTFIGIIQVVLFCFKFSRELQLKNICFELFVLILTLVVGICYISSTYVPAVFLIILNLCAWFNLLNYLKKHPRFGVYVLMMQHIVRSFLSFAPIFLMFLMPFVIMFHVFFSKENSASLFFAKFIHTIVMMTGELNYADSIASKVTFISSIIFTLFVFLMTIFLMNLLVGLAVSDISKILEKVAITRRIMQIETIHHVEISMPEFVRNILWKGFCQEKIELKKLEEKKHRITNAKFQKLFKWFGLPKSAIKDEISNEELTEHAIRMENKMNEVERNLKADLEEQKKNMVEVNSNFNVLIKTLEENNKIIKALKEKVDGLT